MNYDEFYGEAYEVMKQAEMQLLQLIELYETEKEKEHDLKPIIYICSRIKSPDSVLDKLKRKEHGINLTGESSVMGMSRQLTNAATTRKLVFEWKEVSTCLIEVTCRVNILAVQHLFRAVRCIVMSASNYIRMTEHMQASVGMVPSGNVREESS